MIGSGFLTGCWGPVLGIASSMTGSWIHSAGFSGSAPGWALSQFVGVPLPEFEGVLLPKGKLNCSMGSRGQHCASWRSHLPECTKSLGLHFPESPLPAAHSSQDAVPGKGESCAAMLGLVPLSFGTPVSGAFLWHPWHSCPEFGSSLSQP